MACSLAQKQKPFVPDPWAHHGVKAEPPPCAAFEAELQQEVRQCEEKGELRPELQPLRASNV